MEDKQDDQKKSNEKKGTSRFDDIFNKIVDFILDHVLTIIVLFAAVLVISRSPDVFEKLPISMLVVLCSATSSLLLVYFRFVFTRKKTRNTSQVNQHSIDFNELERLIERLPDHEKDAMYQSLIAQKSREISRKLEELEETKRTYESKRTEEAYNGSYKYHRNRARGFEGGFLAVIAIGIYFYYEVNLTFPYDSLDIVKSILPRFFFASVFILLITFSLRRAMHYRKIAQQAHQTSLELEALPLFMRGLREEDRYDIYKDLAGKYFGKEVDQTQNDKIANLIQDQAKMSIEIAQSATEIVKSLKETANSSSSSEEEKSNDIKPNDDGK